MAGKYDNLLNLFLNYIYFVQFAHYVTKICASNEKNLGENLDFGPRGAGDK